MSTAFEYWSSGRGIRNCTPIGKRWPEGESFAEYLVKLIGNRSILEFGCGVGRLAGLFDPKLYVGVDVASRALFIARHDFPRHRFMLIGGYPILPDTEVTLAHTVLLHIPDDKLRPTVSHFRSNIVYVSEILGRQWRRDGDPPVFNRELDEYRSVFEPEYRLSAVVHRPYPYYPETALTIMTFIKNATDHPD